VVRAGRNEKKLKAIRRAEFALKQRLERIDWEEDVLLPQVEEFKGKAALPEPPDENIVEVEFEDDDPS
jgi:hypothetical protein